MGSHLSDEAVAAYADGVLNDHARGRAARHLAECLECRHAVRAQRETVLALRHAPAPSLPAGLFERLQGLPGSSPMPAPIAPAPPRVGFPIAVPLAAFAAAPEPDEADRDGEDQRSLWGLAALFAARARRRS